MPVVLLLFALLLPGIARAALTPEQVEAKLKELDAKMEECAKLKADLEALKGQMTKAPAAPKPSWTDTIKFNGYFQNRYENRKYNGPGGYSDFFMRRMYLNLIATPGDRTLGVLTVERAGPGDPNLTLAQAFAQYKMDDRWSIRGGQAGNNFGIDAAQSSRDRIPLDRALVTEGNSNIGARGLWWRGWTDRGVWLIHKQTGEIPQLTVGLMNGQFSDRGGPGVGKTFEADIKRMTSWGYFGVSMMNGKYIQRSTSGDFFSAINTREALGLYAFKKATPIGGQAELINGKLPGLLTAADRKFGGWYVQGVYDSGGSGFPFVRYEQYDQDKDDPGIYTGWHFGYKWRLNKCNEITFQIDRANNGNRAGGSAPSAVLGSADMYAVQWQMGF
jgi:hypothetical protein